VAPHHRNQVGVLLGDRLVPVFTWRTTSLPFCDLPHTWQKPRKVNVVPSDFGCAFPSGRLKRKSTKRVLSGWSVSSYRARRFPLGVEEVLKRHHGVVGEPDKGASPLEPRFHLVLEPLIQHMMQENVR
jgi:hypothetical protein